MADARDLLTIDINVVRDYLDPGRSGHTDAIALFALNGSAVELAIGPQGTLLDANGLLRKKVARVCREQQIGELRQLAYLSEATFPSDNLYPGQIVNGFKADWTAVVEAWKSDRGSIPRHPDDFHVEAHLLDGRDVFVTADRGLRAMCDRLRDEFGHPIEAMTVSAYLASRQPC